MKNTEWIPFLRQLLLVFASCLNVIGFAGTGSSAAVLMPQLREPDQHMSTDKSLDSLLASAPAIGAALGVQVVPFVIDRFGRKRCHIMNNIPVILGWLIVANATNVYTIIVARLIQGLSLGFHHPITPVVLGECSNPIYRGAFLCSVAISINVGTLYHHLLGTFLNWRILSYIAAIAPALGSLILIFIPDSPVWLLKQGRLDEALKAYTWFRGDGLVALKEFEQMKCSEYQTNQNHNQSLLKQLTLFKKPEFYKPILIMCVIFTAYTFTGTYVISTYMVDIIDTVVSSSISSYVIMNSLDVFRIVITLLTSVIVKKFKRRIIYFWSFSVTVLSLLVLTLYTSLSFKIDFIPILALLTYTIGITFGIQTLPYVIFSEIFPTKFKGIGTPIVSLYMSLMLAASIASGSYMFDVWGGGVTFALFGSVGIVCWVILYYVLPETKDKPLHEIEVFFTDKESTESKVCHSHKAFI